MKTTNAQINKEAEVTIGYETTKFALWVGIAMAAVVGLWGGACLIGGLMNGGLVKGFITAITGN